MGMQVKKDQKENCGEGQSEAYNIGTVVMCWETLLEEEGES